MACCVLLMAFVGQLFTWRRKIWRVLGLPVEDWDGSESNTTFKQTWAARFSSWSQSRGTRFAVGSLLAVELAVISASAWGGTNLYVQHKEHVHQAWSYITGRSASQAPFCTTPPTTASNER